MKYQREIESLTINNIMQNWKEHSTLMHIETFQNFDWIIKASRFSFKDLKLDSKDKFCVG